ncbi:MAG: AAA family ATPase [Nitrospinae bacterium]|nr:AAA family ATPase [Nitrospinota bacterium]
MFKTLSLKFGRALDLSPETIQTTPVTVFVGPNNSGKSKILSEIYQFCTTGQRNVSNILVDQIEFESFSREYAEQRIQRVTLRPNAHETIQPEQLIVGKQGQRHQVPKQQLIDSFLKTNAQAEYFCPWYLAYNTLILDGQNRISLINEQSAGDLQESPLTSFQTLFHDNQKREIVRRIVHDAFGEFLVIDPTNLGRLRLRLSPNEPTSVSQEKGIDDESVKFHNAAQLIQYASDGVKAFSGIITEIVAGDPAILLIDEPEAFLHPALSFNLGKEIALSGSGSEKRLFVSTHSPNFVMGCVQSGAPINIVRLTYRDNVATARLLASEELLTLMRNPLLRSTGVLSGLFYEFVIVTEGDADRAFYQEVNERLLRFKPEWGIPNCLFLNAQNKQTVQTILKPLRNLGIPAAAIVDIDIFKDGGQNWKAFLEGGFVPELERNSLAALRSNVKIKFDATRKDMKLEGGLELLDENDKEAATNLCERLGEYGLFIVREGELESWLPDLQATGHGPTWLVDVFQKMGEDHVKNSYLRPGIDDVWLFLAEIKQWFSNPNRKGIPS